MRTNKNKKRKTRHHYRSHFEETIAAQLAAHRQTFTYEECKLEYIAPAVAHTYTPDFVLSNGIIIETKGRFTTYDRKKHLLVKDQHPDLDIRFVFQRANQPLYRGSPTTYGDWANKHGFKYSDKIVPEQWLKESGANSGKEVGVRKNKIKNKTKNKG